MLTAPRPEPVRKIQKVLFPDLVENLHHRGLGDFVFRGRDSQWPLPTIAFGATTIAAIYKDRWEIELFFKALKQNLKVKSFVGTSENALRIQIWTALIAILLLKWLHHLSKAKWSLSNLASMLRLNLFTYRDLRKWLDDPFETPPLLPQSEQLTLALA